MRFPIDLQGQLKQNTNNMPYLRVASLSATRLTLPYLTLPLGTLVYFKALAERVTEYF